MKKVLFFLFISLLCGGLVAQEEENEEEKLIHAAASPRMRNEGKALLLEGIILVEGGIELENIRREHGVHIELGKGRNFDDLKHLLRGLLNEPIGNELIQKIKTTIVSYFYIHKHAYVAAILPVQEIIQNTIVFEILEGKVGQIRYSGQSWFSESALRRALDVKKGDPIIETQLLNYVTWVNRNPFHHLQLVLEPGIEKGSTDIDFISKERFPVRFFMGSDNTGYTPNGQVRYFTGFNAGNTFGIGDLLSYQYTSSVNFHTFQAHVFNYTSFLSWKQVLTIFGCYGQVYPRIPFYKANGKNVQLSMRWQVPFLPLFGSFRHHLEGGFDWKYLTSNLFFAGDPLQVIPVANSRINITQFVFTWNFQFNTGAQDLTFTTQIYISPWKDLLPFQTTMDFELMRAGSRPRYGYLQVDCTERYRLNGGWVLAGHFRAQLAACALPTSEQFGLGGVDTVRGYYEQQFVADNAICANLELYTPPFPVFDGTPNEFSLIGFSDYGYGYNYVAVSSPYIRQNLLSFGAGLRYNVGSYVSLKTDYGFQLLGIPQDHRFGRFHFSLNFAY